MTHCCHSRRPSNILAHMAEVPVATLRLEDMAAGDGRLAARHAGKAVEAAVEVGGKPGTRFADRPVEQRIMAAGDDVGRQRTTRRADPDRKSTRLNSSH